ncbi:MAG: septum formation initiator family protein [Thermoanaerobaculia bacterium]
MRFERIVGGEGPPRIVGVRPLPPPSRRPEPRPLPELAPETPAPASGARPDAPHVRPASYVAVSLLFSALVFGFFLVNEHGLLQVRRQRLTLAKMQAEVTKLDEDNRKLEAEVAALKSDPKAVEKTARETLNLVKPGEVVLLLPDGWQARVKPPAPPAPSPAAAATSP